MYSTTRPGSQTVGLPSGFWCALERAVRHRSVALDQGRSYELLEVSNQEATFECKSSLRL